MTNDLQQRIITRTPFVILFFSISLVIITGSYLYFHREIDRISADKHNELSAIAQLKTSQISNWMQERMSDAYSVAYSPLFSDAVNTWVLNPENTTLKSKIVERLNIVISRHSYADILIATPDGKILNSFSPEKIPLTPITKQKVREACASKSVQFTDFYFCSGHNRIHIDFIAPIRNDKPKPYAVLILRIAPEDFLYPLIQDWPLPSKTAETLIVRQEGDSILFLNNLRHRPDSALKLRIPLSELGLPAVQAVKGTTGIFEGRDYRNVPVLSHVGPIPGTDWFMVAKIDKNEIYAEMRSRLRLIMISITFLVLTIGVGMSLIYNHRQQGVYRSLYLKEKEHDALLKEFRTTLYSIGDGVITTDQRGVIMFMNPVAEALTGWKEEEARGHDLPEVFKIISEETRQSITNPVIRVFKEGRVIGLANHTLLISRDGKEIPIADSGAPIRKENDEIIGVVLVFRDQTTERQIQKTLRESENQFRNVWEKSRDGMRLSDKNGIIKKVNPAFCKIFGKTAAELEGQPISIIYSQNISKEILDKNTEYFQKNAIVSQAEALFELQDGRSIWFELSNSFLEINGETMRLSIFRDVTSRKLAEAEIRSNEERYHSTLDNMMEGAQIIANDWTYLYLNTTAERHGRRPKEELLGRKYTEIWPGAEETLLFKRMKRCLDEQAVDHFENEFFYPDGSSGWFELSIQPVPEGIFILSVDITARKKAEEHIQYQAGLLQKVSDAIISTDADNYIRMWNPAAEKTYGWKAEEVLGKKFRNIIQPNYKYQPREEVFAQIENIGTWTGEIIHHHRDGHPISILSTISLLRDAAGHVSGMVSVNHDITAQKVAEEKIRQSEAQLRSVWENAQEGMRLTDAEGTVIRVNAAYCKIMNMTREEIEGKPLAVVYAPDRFEHIIKTHQERFKNRSVKPKSEEEVTLRDGRKIWIEVSNSYFEIDNEKPLLLGIFRDITERKKTEEALNRSQEQLRQTQKLEALGQLASGIAHDFNNMLAIILGNTYIMKSNLNDQGKMTRSLDIIESTGQRGANLVKQLLTLARRNEPSITQVNLNELINDTVKMLSETFPKNITFETDIKLTLPYILADVSQIHQVLMNLCVNARDAMPKGGTIKISAKRIPGKVVKQKRINAIAPQYVSISVSDTGIGMDSKTLERIFEPFFTTKGPGKGTGLGLSTVHGIVANHNGFVEVESELGKGTVITVILPSPLETSEAETSSATEDISGLKGGNETILIIEDEDYIIELLRSVLTRFGYEILIAQDGLNGVDTYRKEMGKIALVLSDIGLPRLTGDEVFKRIREINPQAKVILASGFINPEVKSELFKTGLAGFVQKPFFPTLLLKTIREVLDSK